MPCLSWTLRQKDHCLSIKDIMKSAIDVYATKETFQSVNAFGHRVNVIEPMDEFVVEGWKILPFHTQHDCDGCVGFILRTPGGSKVLFATDTFYIRYAFNIKFTHIMIEANYKKSILNKNIEHGRVPALIKNRVLGSHFEIDNVKKFLSKCNLKECKEIHLIHLSKENGDPKLFKKEIERLTGVPTYV